MTLLNLVLLSLASYRLTHLFVYDGIMEPLRDWIKEHSSFFGEMIGCYWCCGIWCSGLLVLALYLLPLDIRPFLLFLAVAGVQTLIETAVQVATKPPESEDEPEHEKAPAQKHRDCR